MYRFLTFLVLTACAAGAALLLFHQIGWTNLGAGTLVAALGYFAGGAVALWLAVGFAADAVDHDRRAVGVAILVAAVWIALAPAFYPDSPRALLHAVIGGSSRLPLVTALFAIALGRLAAFGGQRPLGFGLVVLAPVVVLVDDRLFERSLYPAPFYVGAIGTAAAFVAMIGIGPEYHARIAWAFVALLGATFGVHLLV